MLFNNKLKKSILIISLLFVSSCSEPNQTTPESLRVDNSSIQLGTNTDGSFISKVDKIFAGTDRILLKFKANGLTVKNGKITTNIDVFLKQGDQIVSTENNIFGPAGTSQTVSPDLSYSGSNGSANIDVSIAAPLDIRGEVALTLTLKDLNSAGKLVSFETKFNLK